MSRVGKKPILIPEGVEVKIEGNKVIAKGPKGELSRDIRPEIKVEMKEGKIFVSPEKPLIETKKRAKKIKAFWGLSRALLFNMIQGVKQGFQKQLEMVGLGFRANLEGGDLVLQVGFSHPISIKKPQDIDFSVEKKIITISGIDKEKVSQIAAKIRKVKPPEPYKGKGIRYVGEKVRRKEGKKVVTAE